MRASLCAAAASSITATGHVLAILLPGPPRLFVIVNVAKKVVRDETDGAVNTM